MEPVLTAPGMFTEELAPPMRPETPIQIKEVCDNSLRLAFAHLVSLIFDLPFQMTLNIYGSNACWSQENAGFIGYFEGRPVTVAMACVSDSCCGVLLGWNIGGISTAGICGICHAPCASDYAKSLAFGFLRVTIEHRWASLVRTNGLPGSNPVLCLSIGAGLSGYSKTGDNSYGNEGRI